MLKHLYRNPRASAFALFALTSAAASDPARAGAWTQPPGQGQVIETLFGWTGSGSPYGGSAAPGESKFGAQTYAEYGLTDRLTAVGQLGADRFALAPPSRDAFFGFDYSGAGLRAKLWSDDAWAFSLEASALVSGARNAARPAQAGDTGPEYDARALVGRSMTVFGASAFFDAQAGYRLRTQGPPGEFHADLTLGANVAPRVQILAQTFNTLSDGAGAPGFSPWESHIGQLSLVYALDDKWKIQVGGFVTLYRRNTNSEFGALIAIWRRF